MNQKRTTAIQIAFTYMGTIVGAGFATGQEILQFFTKYGYLATITIFLTALLFIWLGNKMMQLAFTIKARSYEDLNVAVLGAQLGKWTSYFMLLVLLGVSSVMLAGAGSIFEEHWGLSYQFGLLATALLCFFVLRKGLSAILAVNSAVVPLMLLFTFIIVFKTFSSPTADNLLRLQSDYPLWSALLSPFLYTAFNLSLAQAVLVPLGAQTDSRQTIRTGAIWGGAGIGFMLLAGHFALSANYSVLSGAAIPMGIIAKQFGSIIQTIYIVIIFSEIFTTLIADVYGLALQLEQRIRLYPPLLVLCLICLCLIISQIGFQTLLSVLYPAFGFISLIWLIQLLRK